MLDPYLEILLALDDGEANAARIAHATGRSVGETAAALAALERSGFVHTGRPAPADDAAIHITASGRALLRLGYDEVFKRTLTERLGGDAESAS